MALETKSNRMGNEKISKLLFKLSLPAIAGMIIQSLYNIIDSIFIGNLGTEALSALSLAFPVQLIIISLGVGTGVGASSLISRLLGEGKKKRASNAAEHVFFLAIIYGIVFGFIGFFLTDKIMGLFTSDPVLIDLSQRYMRIILTGSLAVFAPATFNYILRGEGNTFVPMLTMFIGAITNIILDPLLIFGIGIFPEMGIEGAATATIISRIFGGIFITFVLFSDKNEIKFDFKRFKFDFSILKEIYQVGIPAMVNRLMMSFAMIIINRILGTFNTTAIGVMGVVFRLQSFYLMAVFGLNQGYLPILGYNYGNRNPDRMKKTVILGWITAFSFGVVGFLAFQLFTEPLLSMFNSSDEFMKIGIPAFKKVSIAYLVMSLNAIGAATFQALGKGIPSLVITFLRQALILLPSMYFLGSISGLNSTWFAFPIAEFTAFTVNITWVVLTIKKCMKTMKYQNNQKVEEYIKS